jgi:hypothetical protein
MRTNHAFMASVISAFVLLSALAYHAAPQHSTTGTVVEFEAREWIAVANEQTDPKGFPIALRETTIYDGNTGALQTGAHVTVWWKSVGERRFVADRVRVLRLTATR